MNEIISYILKVMVVHGLLFGFYWLFLRNCVWHKANRLFLLGALLGAFIIPRMTLSFPERAHEVVRENPVIFWLIEPSTSIDQFELIPVKTTTTFSWWSLLPWFYGLVVLALVMRSAFYLMVLHKLKKYSELIRKRWFTLYKTSQNRPFSFFSNVFIPDYFFGSNAFDQVLTHECVHVRQLHSLDRLLLDFVVSLFWFNPFIYLYRNALIEIHEYQADEAVVRKFRDPIGYQEILFSQLRTPQYSGLVSHFNFQIIKKRIVMMNKQKKGTGFAYLLIIPVTLMMIFAFSSKEAMKPLLVVSDEFSSMVRPASEIRTYTEGIFQPDDEPSILPFKEAADIRITSGFGMRMHPIEKVNKFHQGVDFKCAMGTEIIATADGTVSELVDDPKGYGKMVSINHGTDYVTRYAQLSLFKVAEGDNVKKGQVIALSGSSGASTAPHLHYEVLKNNQPVDPQLYIKNYEFNKVGINILPSEKEQEEMEVLSREGMALAEHHAHLAARESERAAFHMELATKEVQKARAMSLEAEKLRKEIEEERKWMEGLRYRVQELENNPETNLQNGETLKKEEEIRKANKSLIKLNKEKEKQKEKIKDEGQSKRIIIDLGHGGTDPGASENGGMLNGQMDK